MKQDFNWKNCNFPDRPPAYLIVRCYVSIYSDAIWTCFFSYFKKNVYKTFNKIYKSKYSTGSKSLKYKPNKYFNKIFNL